MIETKNKERDNLKHEHSTGQCREKESREQQNEMMVGGRIRKWEVEREDDDTAARVKKKW